MKQTQFDIGPCHVTVVGHGVYILDWPDRRVAFGPRPLHVFAPTPWQVRNFGAFFVAWISRDAD